MLLLSSSSSFFSLFFRGRGQRGEEWGWAAGGGSEDVVGSLNMHNNSPLMRLQLVLLATSSSLFFSFLGGVEVG